LAEILRYLAALDGDLSAEDEELIERCVLPAVQHMRRAIESGNAVYKHLVSAILLELRQLENFKVAAE
jgi:nitrate reductase assembly molybdenum cofactor insertion protein NarJ